MSLSLAPKARWQTADSRIVLTVDGRELLSHSTDRPAIEVGRGDAHSVAHRGHFTLSDTLQERYALVHGWTDDDGQCLWLARGEGLPAVLALQLHETTSGVDVRLRAFDAVLNRLWCRVPALSDEHVWGCGEQFSYLNLRGRSFPLWVGEAGVGRDPSTPITQRAEAEGLGGGGTYHTTYCPQPVFLSSRCYALQVHTSAYACFDFRSSDHHLMHLWEIPSILSFHLAHHIPAVVSALSSRIGRPPRLPEWVMDGAILGLKNGRDHAQYHLDNALKHGVCVSALWCEDWEGLRETSFGKRLFWDWQWSTQRYPQHAQWVASLAAQHIRFLGYVNPYLCEDGPLFREAQHAGYLITQSNGDVYRVDFGEFICGMVDFSLPAAAEWFEVRVLHTEMLSKGLSGWMADFGEYQPPDAVVNGGDGWQQHNLLPVLWARSNARAIERAGKTGEALFFMRSGYTGSQRYCSLMWAGDQSVDFSRHDGLPSVISAALSAGLVGFPYHHSDIGGYTSLFGNVRSPELFQRWAELAAFTAVMRTHEGNRPDDNVQFWHSPEVLAHFARMTQLYAALKPYRMQCVKDADTHGWPLQRPLFFHFENDLRTWALQDCFLLGADLLVAPVLENLVRVRHTYLPQGERWVHLWTRQTFEGGQHVTVAAPLGSPPVFVREKSEWLDTLLTVPQQLGRAL